MGEKERYARHLILEEIGEPGQEKLKRAKVLVVGAGGLGSPVLLYLTAAGIGRIGILDNDIVSESNLQRQILYDTQCLGALKVEVAARKLQALNPYTTIVPYAQRLTSENTFIIAEYDLVIDATDNLPSRYLIDEACVRYGKPFVYGSICEFKGQVSVFNYQGGPTYRDLYEYHKLKKGLVSKPLFSPFLKYYFIYNFSSTGCSPSFTSTSFIFPASFAYFTV